MSPTPPSGSKKNGVRTGRLLAALAASFLGVAALLFANLWGDPPTPQNIPLVEKSFLETTPWRQTYADLVKAKEDLSDYDCYACHEEKQPTPIRFDENHKIVIPKEHANIEMGHGSHDRNNLCYNCHNEANLLTLQVRDGRELEFENSPSLCGSCHGPTYRDWEAGAHGRTSGHWALAIGTAQRLACVNCHNPHAPKIPTREPAPGPRMLREPVANDRAPHR